MHNQQTPEESTSKARILIVDDDPVTIDIAQAALRAGDLEILAVHSAAEAEEALAAHDVALILLGLVLPDADGRNVVATLSRQSRTAGIPVFMVSGKVGSQPKAECLALGATDFLEKPINESELAWAVESALESGASPKNPFVDPLTGLPNRAGFAEAFARNAASWDESAATSVIALLDLDNLSQVNDGYGRSVGDEVLRLTALGIAGALRDSDTLGRWQEDEFVLLLPNTQQQRAARLIAKAQAALTTSPVDLAGGAELATTFSAGIASVVPGISVEEAVALADRALVRAKAAGSARIVTDEDEGPPMGAAVLVAEDDRVTATVVKHRLERAGLEVVHCDDGSDALRTAQVRHFALFILDIRMPGLDGFELLERLRSIHEYAETPILMLTSLGREEDIVRAFNLNANDYVTKPFSPVELLARVQRLLRMHASSPRH